MARGTKRKSATAVDKSSKKTETATTKRSKAAASATTTESKTASGCGSSSMFSSSSSRKTKAAAAAAASSSGNNKKNASGAPPPQLSAEASIDKMFHEFADTEDPTIMSMEGISKLCDQLHIDPLEDVRVLLLLWKLVDAASTDKPGQLTKTEFTSGCARLKITTVEQFRSVLLPTLDTGFLDQKEFREFYKFCFQFNRQGTHRTLDQDMVTALLQLVLQQRVPKSRLESFAAFLEYHTNNNSSTNNNSNSSTNHNNNKVPRVTSGSSPYSRMTLDQWTSFLDFCTEYDDDDLSAYDESTSAWPVMIDEYVEYIVKMKQQEQQQQQ